MPDFSIILQAPEVRQIVQQNMLERAFHDALYPRLLFRGEASPQVWPANVGDEMIFSAPGLIPVDARPIAPGDDPEVVTYPMEQWSAKLQSYGKSIDTHMPTSMVAIANLFLRNAHQLGLQAARTLNTIVRDRLYNAALSGWTVVDGAAQTGTVLRVKRLNGFTRARRPDLGAGSPVRFDSVSSTNPLVITVTGATPAANTVVGFTPDNAGDEIGPGTLTLGTTITGAAADRAAVMASDRTFVVRVGGGDTIDALIASDIPTLSDIRSAVAHMWEQNVPEHPDGRFHAHLGPTSQAKIFADQEFQRLLTALPDYYMYREFALGELLGTVFFRNNEVPTSNNVVGGATASFDLRDPFAGELFTGGVITGVPVSRILFTGQGGIMEYYSDLANLLTDAGVVGRIADPRIVNNGIEIFSDRIQMIIRAPLNRFQDQVATSWRIISDWPIRTDAASGDASRFKRILTIEHGQ